MSGHGSLDHAKRAIEDGAIDFYRKKPISLKLLLSGIKNGLAKWSDRQKQLDEDRTRDRRMRRRANNSGPRPALPAFDIKEYGLTIDFNRPFRDMLYDFERAYFRTVLKHLNHSMADLARHAGMERTHLYRKIRMLGLDVEAMREEARQAPYNTPAVAKPNSSALSNFEETNLRATACSGNAVVRLDMTNSIEFLPVQHLTTYGRQSNRQTSSS